MKAPVRVAVTGAAGQISYSLLFRVAAGEMLGADQPVILQLLEITPALEALKGTVMEIEDCAFPLVSDIVATDDPMVAFKDADYCLLVGARPRGPGMERKDLLEANARIFSEQGAAINTVASRDVKVLVVGNPANTNALIAYRNAPDLDPGQFTAMTRLDHNRAISQLAAQTGKHSAEVDGMIIWAITCHAISRYSPLHCRRNGGAGVGGSGLDRKRLHSHCAAAWCSHHQGAGASSAASAANAAIEHMRDWALGTAGKTVSMGIHSDGSYGVEKGLIYSFPVTCSGGSYEIVQGLDVNTFSQELMDKTETELREERIRLPSCCPSGDHISAGLITRL